MSLRNPVKYPVKYYSWQDDQAPQLANVDGVIKTILKACLVTGYGSKAGAGWTALFEDAYRIVLRRPLRTGNPPDIKIENGTITGTTVRHRIVAQDNPTGLDDATELSAVNLIARDNNAIKEWHCFVTDFAFLLFYGISESATGTNGNHLNGLFVGSMQKINEASAEPFFVSSNTTVAVNGSASYATALLDYNQANPVETSFYLNMRNNTTYSIKNHLTITGGELAYDNDYFAQKILLDNVAVMPFLTAMTNSYVDKLQKQVSINGRSMMRVYNVPYGYGFTRPLYIPLDYWEL